MGGSIRVPAAFNGLYAIRPTADRVPKGGMDNINSTGQTTIQLSCGPICHSIGDLELLTKVINAYPHNKYDVTCAPIPWRNVDTLNGKLAIGIMKWDGVVMPHPPILRALGHVKQVLERAGHQGKSLISYEILGSDHHSPESQLLNSTRPLIAGTLLRQR
jgi:amidase